MAFKNKLNCDLSFNLKNGKSTDDGSYFMERITKHPIIQLLNLKRKSRNVSQNPVIKNEKCGNIKSKFYVSLPSASNDNKTKVCNHSLCSRRTKGVFASYRGHSAPSYSNPQKLRPIGLSKSEDEILGRSSDSPEEEDYLEDYREGRQARDLACDIQTLHVSSQCPFTRVQKRPFSSCKENSKLTCRHSAHFVSTNKECNQAHHLNTCRPFSCSLNKFGSSKVQPKLFSSLEGNITKGNDLSRRRDLVVDVHKPPGSDPLPIKFRKKPPQIQTEPGPSSWFSPIGVKCQEPLNNKSLRYKNNDLRFASSLEEATQVGSSRSSSSSLNDSMIVLVDSESRPDLKSLNDYLHSPSINIKYSSADSVVTSSAMSSMESLRSSISDGSKGSACNDSGFSGLNTLRSSSFSSDCGHIPRPFLNLSQPHRSLIHSAKFQILSPISDKSQETSLDVSGSYSQKTSPQEYVEINCLSNLKKTPTQINRNIQDDFRNVHHIIPEPRQEKKKPPSDSGISTDYQNNNNNSSSEKRVPIEAALNDLPFDMPKLRRKLAGVKAGVGGSNSSISSGIQSHDSSARLSLPAGLLNGSNSGSPLHPAISKLQGNSAISQSSSSNSSDWDVRSSAESSSEQGTPKNGLKAVAARQSLALALGCSAMSVKGQHVEVDLPLAQQTWYHGFVTREEAETLLKGRPEGSYLVRSLTLPKHDYSLSLKSAKGFMHLRLRFVYASGCYTMGRCEKLFPSVPHIVGHFSIYRIPIKGAEHMVLLHPVHSDTL